MWIELDDLKTVMRLGLAVVALATVYVAKMIGNVVGNRRLSGLADRVFWFFLVIVVARVAAAALDALLGFEIGWFSTGVTYGFNAYLLYLLVSFYRQLKSEQAELHKTDGAVVANPRFINKSKLSTILDEMFDELKVNIRKTNRLEQMLKRR